MYFHDKLYNLYILKLLNVNSCGVKNLLHCRNGMVEVYARERRWERKRRGSDREIKKRGWERKSEKEGRERREREKKRRRRVLSERCQHMHRYAHTNSTGVHEDTDDNESWMRVYVCEQMEDTCISVEAISCRMCRNWKSSYFLKNIVYFQVTKD